MCGTVVAHDGKMISVAARSSSLRSVISQMLEPDFTKRPTVDEIIAMPSMRKVGAGQGHRDPLAIGRSRCDVGVVSKN